MTLFRPLKAVGKKVVHNWRTENNSTRLKREHFAPLLKKAIETISVKEIMPNGFRSCGLHPFSADGVNYEKYFKTKSAC